LFHKDVNDEAILFHPAGDSTGAGQKNLEIALARALHRRPPR